MMKAFDMGQLTVRDVDDAIVAALKVRAAANGRSMEAEHRQILREALDADHRARDEFRIAAARLRRRIGSMPPDAPRAEDIVRDMRDNR
jgi:plasmid stability protein